MKPNLPDLIRLSGPLVRSLLQVATLLTLIGLLSHSPINAQEPSPTYSLDQVSPPDSPPTAGSGRAIYVENCAPCHGITGMGDGPSAADLPGPPTAFADPNSVWDISPAELFHTVKFGRIQQLMPPWLNRLNDQQIWQAVSYSWSLHTSQEEVESGAELYTENCVQCHGELGAGDGVDATPETPDFSDLDYVIANSQADWATGWQTAHDEIGGDWSDADQQAGLEYIRTFSYVPPWESSFRAGQGLISGQVIQGTEGGQEISGLPVSLEAYVDFSPVAFFTATTDVDGLFEFPALATDSNVVYLASTAAQGVSYSSPILTLTGNNPTVDTTIQIYEPTTDDSNIAIDRAHWIIDSQPGALIVGQIMTFNNESDRTFVGTEVDGLDIPVTVAAYIPAAAQEINLENGALGDRYRRVGNIVYDTAPIIPGTSTRQLIIRYAVPYDGSDVELDQEFLYPVNTMNLLIADLPELETEVETLLEAGIQEIQGNDYRLWQGEDLDAGSLPVGLSGLLEAGDLDPRALADSGEAGGTRPVATGAPSYESWMTWLIGAIVILTLAGAFIWSWRKGRVSNSVSRADRQAQHDALIEEIARLDDLHAVGEIDDNSWQGRRAELKTQLLALAAEETNRA